MSSSKGQYVNSNTEEINIVSGRETGFIPEPKGLGYTFFQYMSRNRHKIAQIDGISGTKDTYGHLLERCINAALEMQRKNIKPKDIITICSVNQLNACVPFISALFLGAIPACLDPLLGLSDTVHLLKQVKPKFAFIDEDSLSLIENALLKSEVNTEIIVFGESDKYTEFRDFVTAKSGSDLAPFEVSDIKQTAIIFFSSGTTGMPKGICVTHCGLLGQGNILTSAGICFQTTLSYASYYWISTTLLLIATILTGGSRLIVPSMKPSVHWKILNKYKVTCTFLSPSHSIAVYKHGRPVGNNYTYLRDILIGGGPLAAPLLQEIRELFPHTNCTLVYGQTECAGVVLNVSRLIKREVTLMCSKPESSGFLCSGFLAKVVDVETKENLGPNQKGELCFKSDYLMNGYYNTDSSEAWYPNGWLRSGDIGYYDDDYCFYIVDRIKEVLKFQSYHVPPSVVEAILLSHPKIRIAAVIGIPHEEDGDHPLGVISLKDGMEAVSEEEIIKYVEERVDDRYRLRGGVKFLKEMPLTVTGKVHRHYLKRLILDNNV